MLSQKSLFLVFFKEIITFLVIRLPQRHSIFAAMTSAFRKSEVNWRVLLYQFCILGLLSNLLCGCSEQYSIAGSSSVACLDGRMLYLQVTPDGRMQSRLDSCQVVHGQFSFSGDVDSVVVAQLFMGGESVMPVVLENGSVSILVDNVSQRVQGSPLNNKLYKFLQERQSVENDIWQLEQQCLRMMREGCSPDEIHREILPKTKKLHRKMENIEVKFVKQNYDNALGPAYFILLCNQYPFPVITDQIRRIVKDAPPAFLSNPLVHNYLFQAGYHE